MASSNDSESDMQRLNRHNTGTPEGSEKLSDFMVSLAALADDIRETDVIACEVQELAASLSEQLAQLPEVDGASNHEQPFERVRTRTRSLAARLSAVVAALLIGTGGLGVAGALPAPIQSAFDGAVEAIQGVTSTEEAGAVEEYVVPESEGGTTLPAPTGDGSTDGSGAGDGDTDVVATDPSLGEEAPGNGDLNKSDVAVAVAEVIDTYDRETATESLGKVVSAVASAGKAGGTAATVDREPRVPEQSLEQGNGKGKNAQVAPSPELMP